MAMPAATRSAARPARTVFGVVSLVAIAGVLLAGRPWLIDAVWPALADRRGSVGYHAVLQATGLLLAAATLALAYRLSAGRVRAWWGIGKPAAPASAVRWLGIRAGTSWRRVGLVMLLWISALLGAFLYLGLAAQLSHGLSPALLAWALVFAVTNSLTEEVVFRLSVVGVLHGVVSEGIVLAVGATIFGAVHVVGVPGGPIGVLMAGFLGWFLTRSIVETSGLFWALLIHVVLDLIIFGFLLHL